MCLSGEHLPSDRSWCRIVWTGQRSLQCCNEISLLIRVIHPTHQGDQKVPSKSRCRDAVAHVLAHGLGGPDQESVLPRSTILCDGPMTTRTSCFLAINNSLGVLMMRCKTAA